MSTPNTETTEVTQAAAPQARGQDWFITAADVQRPLISQTNGKFEFPSNFAESLLPEHISLQMVKDVQQAETQIEAVAIRAAGPVAIEAFNSDPSLDAVHGKFKIGSSTVTLNVARSTSYPNPQRGNDGQGDRIVYHAETTLRRSPQGNAALDEARNAIRAMGGDLLKK